MCTARSGWESAICWSIALSMGRSSLMRFSALVRTSLAMEVARAVRFWSVS
jgi:hypothetical protein